MSIPLRDPCAEGLIRHGRAAQRPCVRTAERWVLAATILGSSLAFIDGTVVNVALPALQAQLNATLADVQWIVEGYALTLAALVLVGGALGDRYGSRKMFALGVALFALASAACGLALSVGQIIAARGVQGVGAALMVPGSLAIISAAFPDNERGRAIGIWSGFTALATAIGPLVGGGLIEQVSWRAIFFLNLPLAAIVLWIVWRHVPPDVAETHRRRLDAAGGVLATLALGAIVYGLIESGTRGFDSPLVIAALGAGVALLPAFVLVERRVSDPMLPLALFRSRDFAGANLLTFFLYAALGGALFFFPLNLIQLQGYSATEAGAALLPFVLLMFALSSWSGGLVARTGPKLPLVAGPLIVAVGFALFMLPATGGSYWRTFFPAIVVLGVGMAVSVAPLTATVMGAVAKAEAGVASGINNAVARTAGLIAVAALGIVMAQAFDRALDSKLTPLQLAPEVGRQIERERSKLGGMQIPAAVDRSTREALRKAIGDAFVAGFRDVMGVAVVLSLLAAATAAFSFKGKTRAGDASGKSR